MRPANNKKPNLYLSLSLKVILPFSLLFFLLVLLGRSSFPPTRPAEEEELHQHQQQQQPKCRQSVSDICSKIPPSLSRAIAHYAALNVTPQQTLDEIGVTLRVLERRSPCNLLVFGLGIDSLMWASLNHNGRTVFLEEDRGWIQQVREQNPSLESHHVVYDTKLTQAAELLETGRQERECSVVVDPRRSKCKLSLGDRLPREVYDLEWDVIMVDAPTGYFEGAPGRMKAIYTVGLMARNRESGETDVFVHDVNRAVEHQFSMAWLCEGYLREEVGRLRHFTIPSHRTREGRSFCP
ncbi:hypothetical protein M569_06817 [Genlisea aurea]|uniref:Uncharacterized protein n=1 Tax=Genlisea aurea TaxID=192259 RepID=S8DXF4_9LAMI|nr:hypothetical protein M569_06817 [Genlisea aurea]